MATPMAIEINCETGEVVERPFTADEIAQNEENARAFALEEANRAAKIASLEALKASARTKLVAGEPLTPEEAATIVL